MPTTRAMAREASVILEDKENDVVPALRKPPARRTTTKAPQTSRPQKNPAPATRTSSARKAAMPLSPKKNVQLPQRRTRQQQAKAINDFPAKSAIGGNNTRGQTQASVRATPCTTRTTTRSAGAAITEVAVDRKDPVKTDRGGKVQTASTTKKSRDQRPVDNKRPETSADTASESVPYGCISPTGKDSGSRPAPDTTTATPREQSTSLRSQHNLHLDLSEDELCGPTTPYVRSVAETKPLNQCEALQSTVSKSGLQTPSYNMLDHHTARDYFSYTQKVPTKQAAESLSPRRPMSVARGSSVAYVFHPLPGKSSRTASPIATGPYQWPVTPSDDEAEQDNLPTPVSTRRTRSVTPATSDRATQARDHLISLFSSGAASEDEDEDDEEEEDEQDESTCHFPDLQAKDASELAANADYEPEDEDSTEDEESSETDLDDTFDASIDSSVLAPEIDSELMQSTPVQAPPVLSQEDFDSLLESDDEITKTPAVHNISELSDDSIASAPRPGILRFTADTTTPVSNKHNDPLPFKTPPMHSALDEFEDVTQTPRPQATHRRRTIGIDPSVLQSLDSIIVEQFAGAPDATITASPVKPMTGSAIGSAGMESPIKSPEKDRAGPRLSMFLNTEELLETPELEQSGPFDGSESGQINDNTLRMLDASFDGHHSPKPEHSERSDDESVLATPDEDNASDDGESNEHTPHYALPTIAYDNRRKSMPLATRTPDHPPRLRAAETAVRPGPTPSFAQAWLHRHSASLTPSRRRSMMDLNSPTASSVSEVASPSAPSPAQSSPTTTPSSRPTLLPRSTSTLSLRSRPSLPSLRPSPAADLTPKPRVYTPSSPFASIKFSATKPSGLSQSPFKLHPKPRLPRKPSPIKQRGAFTPHPAAPLRGVTAVVQVRSRNGEDASAAFEGALVRLGAKLTRSVDAATHLVFKDGDEAVRAAAKTAGVRIVGSRWVADCDRLGRRVDEEEYGVDGTPEVKDGGVDVVALEVERE